MKLSTIVTFAASAAAVLFIVFSAQSMPAVVASHFAGDGAANGFMPRTTYLALMIAITAGSPLLLLIACRVMKRVELQSDFAQFSVLFLLFICFVHWLVVQANALQPQRLESEVFFSVLVVYVIGTGLWIVRLVRRFR